MNYQPLARKYRPQDFEELVGQPHVTTTLVRAIETKRIGQAYLFAGQRGVGKTSAARILAKCLNCSKGPTAKPCQSCPSCIQITQGSSLDVIEIDGASNRGIDEIRSLRETVKFAPTQGPYRLYIIDEVHQITHDGFNALLKTLEEPPAHVKFIFATTAPHKVPPTILSRCQRFDFRRLDGKTIVSVLQQIAEAERIAMTEGALYTIARASEGSLRDAEVVLEQLVSFCAGTITEQEVNRLLGAIEQDTLLAWTQALLGRDANTALQLLSQQLDQGKDVTQLLIGLLMHLRNLLILRTTADLPASRSSAQAGARSRPDLLEQLLDVPAEQLMRLDEQAKRASPEELLVMGQLLAGAYELARRSPFAQAILEFALIKLATRESWASLEQVIQRLDRLARGSPTSGPVTPPSDLPVMPAESQAPAMTSAAQADPPEPVASDVVGTVSLEEVSVKWPKVLERLGRQKMSLAAYLTDARPLGVVGNQIQLGLPAFTLHQEVLNLAENLRLVEWTFGEVFAKPLSVRYLPAATAAQAGTTLPEPLASPATPGVVHHVPSAVAPESPAHPVPPIVQDIVKLFDATIVEQPPSPS